MIHLMQAISPQYINHVHDSDSIYYSLTRLGGIIDEDEGYNLQKVDQVLQLILMTWLNNSCFLNCAQKNTFSLLCSLFNTLS